MSRIRVVTDSTADFAPRSAEQLGVTVVPLSVVFGRESLLDKTELSIDQFYQRLRSGKDTPTTSAPSVGAFEETYRQVLADADHVISLHISAKLSATWGAAKTAAENVAPDRITVLDSGQITLCLGWAAEHAAARAEEGCEVQTIVRELEDMFARLRVYAVLDTLEFLQRGGRIGKARALLGTLLNVKPILLIQHGEVLPFERVRTRLAAVRRLAEIVADIPHLEKIGVLEADATEASRAVLELVQRQFPEREIPVARVGAVLGTHGGPGIFGVACLTAS